jgi:hypothetical protein
VWPRVVIPRGDLVPNIFTTHKRANFAKEVTVGDSVTMEMVFVGAIKK